MTCYAINIDQNDQDLRPMAYAATSQRYKSRKLRARTKAPGRKMGTWKMAYADFLTALMAFFLLMWLINGVTPEDRAELADYFGGETAAATSAPVASDISELARLISADPVLSKAGANVTVTATPTHIRINLVDSIGQPLFETADGALNETGLKLAQAAGRAISAFDFPLAIEGHTDAFPSALPGYSNWELSSDRANAARRAVEQAGVNPARIRAVTGMADTAPLKPGQPHLAANRRISIVLDISGKALENHRQDK